LAVAPLNVQSIVGDRPLSRWVRSDVAEVKAQHVGCPPNDGEPKTDQHVEGFQLHVPNLRLAHFADLKA
jgi:hypothetical protein